MKISLPENQIKFTLVSAKEVNVSKSDTVQVLLQKDKPLTQLFDADQSGLAAVSQRKALQDKSATETLSVSLNHDVVRLQLFQTGDKALDDASKVVSSAKAAATAAVSAKPETLAIDLSQLDLTDQLLALWLRQWSSTVVEKANELVVLKEKPKNPITLSEVTVIIDESKKDVLDKALTQGQAIGVGINVARQLADLPANICTPTFIADKASELAGGKLVTEIKDGEAIQELGMGAFWGVAKGSVEDARLITMTYSGGDANDEPIVFVGKGLTFDSGGISIKPGAAMDEMKYDMGGAAAVMGIMAVVKALDLPLNVMGLIGSCENMPDAGATKPGDVLTSMSGKTIEVLNTDAEGRLVLCDVLHYAKQYKPKAIIDMATLTGAIIVGLGRVPSGLFSNDDDLANELLAAGDASQDRLWRLPIWDEYQKQLKSNFADFGNIGGRDAGSITAACFLANFVEGEKWAHLDIAGTAWNSGANKGATGRPVTMLAEYLFKQVEKA